MLCETEGTGMYYADDCITIMMMTGKYSSELQTKCQDNLHQNMDGEAAIKIKLP